jgi:Spy/CpxP family protein refolding chaperone
MVRAWASRVLCGIVLASLAIAFVATERPTLADDTPVKQVTRWRRGRLPAYYSKIVTEEQRDKINKIQEEYQTKFEALKKERDEKISAVLTDEQKKKVEEAAVKAKEAKAAKSAAKDADKAKTTAPATTTPATSTPTTTTPTEPKPAK